MRLYSLRVCRWAYARARRGVGGRAGFQSGVSNADTNVPHVPSCEVFFFYCGRQVMRQVMIARAEEHKRVRNRQCLSVPSDASGPPRARRSVHGGTGTWTGRVETTSSSGAWIAHVRIDGHAHTDHKLAV
jgi:hypothetical protein